MGLAGCLAVVLVIGIGAVLAIVFFPRGRDRKEPVDRGPRPASGRERPSAPEARPAAAPSKPRPAGTADAEREDERREEPEDLSFRLVEVVTAEEVRGSFRGGHEVVKLAGIDAPAPGRPGYAEAKAALRELVEKGDLELAFEGEPRRDRKSRLLARVLASGTNVNLELMRRGLARPRRLLGTDPFASELEATEKEARSARRGIWGWTMVLTRDGKRRVAREVSPEGGVTLADGTRIEIDNFVSTPVTSLGPDDLGRLFGFGEGGD
jgi:endonuclease YncB( thermonuclease family)